MTPLHAIQADTAPDTSALPSAEVRTTDVGNASRLVRDFADEFRYVPGLGWVTWDGTHWVRDTTGRIHEAAKSVARRLYHDAGQASSPETRKALARWAATSESAPRQRAMVDLAATDPRVVVTIDQLDADPSLLNTPNGTLDLRTGDLQPHSRRDLITKCTTARYEPDASCPTWDQFLERTTRGRQELIAYLARIVGYSLTGDVSEHVMFLLHGHGANGKSTFLNALLDALGDYAATAEPDLLLARHDHHPTGIADLQGRRLVVAMESDQGRRLDEGTTKRLTGGDPIKARFMRGDFFEFWPTHKLWLATNHAPRIRGTDEGIWRRITLVPFDVRIPEADRDRHLPVRLAAELDGILAWAVTGCLAWRARGLDAPAAVRLATTDYRATEDTLAEFLDDYLQEHPDGWVLAGDLFTTYRDWCDAHGERAGSQKALGQELTRRGAISERRVVRGKRGRAWRLHTATSGHEDALFDNSVSPQSVAIHEANTENPVDASTRPTERR